MEINPLPEANKIPERTVIWRYMDLQRFIWMLATNRLWFAKAANLHDDPWEGFGKAERFQIVDDEPMTGARTAAPGATETNSFAPMVAHLSHRSADIFENAQQHLYVNSWCMDASESMAMWEIYGAGGLGVALRSSVESYQNAARFEIDSSHYLFGEVAYHDHLEMARDVQADFRSRIPMEGPGLRSEVLKLGLHKRSCFRYEREWRAVLYQDHRPTIGGVAELFDLEHLIDAVYVGPRAAEFAVEAVTSIMEKFSLQKPLNQSTLLRSPRPHVAVAV